MAKVVCFWEPWLPLAQEHCRAEMSQLAIVTGARSSAGIMPWMPALNARLPARMICAYPQLTDETEYLTL